MSNSDEVAAAGEGDSPASALSDDQMQRLQCALRIRDRSGCGYPPLRRPTGRGITATVVSVSRSSSGTRPDSAG